MKTPDEFLALLGEDAEEEVFKHGEWEQVYTFEPLESFESFKIMEQFVGTLGNGTLRNRVVKALNRRRPFANFKAIVENSEYRQEWFDFKKAWLESHVKKTIWTELNRLPDEYF